MKYFLLLFVVVVSAFLGIFTLLRAQKKDESPFGDHDLVILKFDSYKFEYQRLFAEPPSNQTNEAWRSLLPSQGGFFTHPKLAPTRGTFSAFHQIHCLDNLRVGYYLNSDAASNGRTLSDDDVPWDARLAHIRHCFDFPRQSLICNADTTFEAIEQALQGVHGFNTEHQCKDWQQLLDWTDARQKADGLGRHGVLHKH